MKTLLPKHRLGGRSAQAQTGGSRATARFLNKKASAIRAFRLTSRARLPACSVEPCGNSGSRSAASENRQWTEPWTTELLSGFSGWSFWQAQMAGWLLLAFVGFLLRHQVFGSLPVAIVLTVVVDPLGFVLTSAVAVFVHTRYASVARPFEMVALAALWCLAAAGMTAGVAYAIRAGFGMSAGMNGNVGAYETGLLYFFGVYTVWMFAFFGIRADARARFAHMAAMQAETRALRLELEYLQSQLAPHFLFNALNTVLADISARPAIAEKLVRYLAEYLRYSLSKRNDAISALREELLAAETYFHIMAIRFDEQFAYEQQVSARVLDFPVPHLALQCLVENAIKHGLRQAAGKFEINLHVRGSEQELLLEVDNPGILNAPSYPAHAGVGLENLLSRLALRYPHRYDFTLFQREDRTVARLRLWGGPCSV